MRRSLLVLLTSLSVLPATTSVAIAQQMGEMNHTMPMGNMDHSEHTEQMERMNHAEHMEHSSHTSE